MELIENYKYYSEEFAKDVLLLGENTHKIYEWAFSNDTYENGYDAENLEYKDFENNQQVLDSFNSCNYIVRRKLNI